MKATPVLILKPNGDVAIPMDATDLVPLVHSVDLAPLVHTADLAPLVHTADLAPLATNAALVALQVLVAALPQSNTKIAQVTIPMAVALVDSLVPLGTLVAVETVVVKSIVGTATLKFGAVGSPAVPLVAGEVRNNLNVAALYLNSPGGAGGTITLELQGR